MTTLKNERTGETKQIKQGFSWTSLFFGIFVPLIRADLVGFALQIILASLTFGLSWLVVPFIYNKRYVNRLLDKGWIRA